jgi:hypothetical protein
LPLQHQDEIVRFAFVAAATIAYGIILGILLRPIGSRSLVTHAALPAAAPPRPSLLEARAIPPVAPPLSPRSPRGRTGPARSDAQFVAVQAMTMDPNRRTAVPAPRSERRSNIFSRFFRGVWRSVQSPAVKTESL